jgi:hypothetical protein
MHQTSAQTVRTARSFRIEVTSLDKPLTRNGPRSRPVSRGRSHGAHGFKVAAGTTLQNLHKLAIFSNEAACQDTFESSALLCGVVLW